jgi:hypothetical protein
MNKQKISGQVIKAQTGVKRGMDLTWFKDMDYEAKPNKYGWLDLTVIEGDDFMKTKGEVLEGCAWAIKSICPECGEPNYEAFMVENSDIEFYCKNCNHRWEVDDLKQRF